MGSEGCRFAPMCPQVAENACFLKETGPEPHPVPGAKRLDVDLETLQAVEQVLAEGAFLGQLRQVRISRRDDSAVDPAGLDAAHRADIAGL